MRNALHSIESTLSVTEDIPALWPKVSPVAQDKLFEAAKMVRIRAMIWQWLEMYTLWRWTAREVVYIVEGPTRWRMYHSPLKVTSVERQKGEAWKNIAFHQTISGTILLKTKGIYRITGIAGDNDCGMYPPNDIQDAWKLVYSYLVREDEARIDDLLMRHVDGRPEDSLTNFYINTAISRSGAGAIMSAHKERWSP